ncbi:MAG: chromosome segregation and condensation protein ScpA [Candidatus Saccharibacteria bacterium]|jgi:segregation and condensation protein A|nr:chromosome segregation and condensation protein ScpA [Candidatus Saccharibacteria bacterium]
MTHTVAVEQFEGPLGILLDLVEKGRLEVTDISVAEITAGYLDRIKQLDDRSPEELADFVQLGARLLYIKSLALLPRSSDTEQVEELRQLNIELAEYRQMQTAARELARRTSARSFQRTATERLSTSELPLPSLDLTELSAAFTRALKRMEPAPARAVIKSHTSIETVITRIKRRLDDGSFGLQELLDSCRDRFEVVVTFLALLELVRDDSVRVVQAGQFDPIMVEASGA